VNFLPPESNVFLPVVTFRVFMFIVSWRLAGQEVTIMTHLRRKSLASFLLSTLQCL